MTEIAALLAAGSVLAAIRAAGFVWLAPPLSKRAWWRVASALGVLAAVFFMWGKQ